MLKTVKKPATESTSAQGRGFLPEQESSLRCEKAAQDLEGSKPGITGITGNNRPKTDLKRAETSRNERKRHRKGGLPEQPSRPQPSGQKCTSGNPGVYRVVYIGCTQGVYRVGVPRVYLPMYTGRHIHQGGIYLPIYTQGGIYTRLIPFWASVGALATGQGTLRGYPESLAKQASSLSEAASGPLLGRLWAASGPPLGRLWAVFGLPFGLFWPPFGLFWPPFGRLWAAFWAAFGPPFGRLWAAFGPSSSLREGPPG